MLAFQPQKKQNNNSSFHYCEAKIISLKVNQKMQ